MNNEQRLSEHFTLSEFTRSATAERRGINNEPPLSVVSNLQRLVQEVLEPLRSHYQRPVVITSGYRCRELNEAVGGVAKSLHMSGRAADFYIPGISLINIYQYIKTQLPHKELLLEPIGSKSPRWIHVGL